MARLFALFALILSFIGVPLATISKAESRVRGRIKIEVTENEILFAGEPISLTQLKALVELATTNSRFPHFRLHLQADSGLATERIKEVIQAAGKMGINDVIFSASPLSGGTARQFPPTEIIIDYYGRAAPKGEPLEALSEFNFRGDSRVVDLTVERGTPFEKVSPVIGKLESSGYLIGSFEPYGTAADSRERLILIVIAGGFVFLGLCIFFGLRAKRL